MSDLIVVAEGEEAGGWVLEWDAAAWNALTIKERTTVICDKQFDDLKKGLHELQTADYLADMMRPITDGRLKRLVLEAWEMIPEAEQRIIRALGPTVKGGVVEDGSACAISYAYDKNKRLPHFRFEITVDLDKAAKREDSEVINHILHEFVHVAYRHGVIDYWLKRVKTPEMKKRNAVFTWLVEAQTVIQARAWQDAAASGDSAVN